MLIKTQSLIESIVYRLHVSYPCPILCTQYAWWVLESILNKSQTELMMNESIDLSDEQATKLADWISKLVDEKIPLAYLLGSVPFDGVTVLVESPILIPRSETEEWTVNLINELKKIGDTKLCILDLCTGSGCIALALAKHFPQSHIVAVDINEKATELTKKNCQHNNLTNIEIITSDLFESIPQHYKFDLIVGNPPYIDEEDWSNLEPSVKKWEDKMALTTDNHGMAIIEKIIDGAVNYLRPNEVMENLGIAQLVLEIDCIQGLRVLNNLKNAGYCNTSIEKDLEGKDRVAKGRILPCGHLK